MSAGDTGRCQDRVCSKELSSTCRSRPWEESVGCGVWCRWTDVDTFLIYPQGLLRAGSPALFLWSPKAVFWRNQSWGWSPIHGTVNAASEAAGSLKARWTEREEVPVRGVDWHCRCPWACDPLLLEVFPSVKRAAWTSLSLRSLPERTQSRSVSLKGCL